MYAFRYFHNALTAHIEPPLVFFIKPILDEPNNRFNNNEDCVLVESTVPGWSNDGEAVWKDYPCCGGDKINAVICQRGKL